MEPILPRPDSVVTFMRTRPVIAVVLSPLLLIYFLWLYPVLHGIDIARSKGLSPRWMWFGLHPLGGWIAYMVLRSAQPRGQLVEDQRMVGTRMPMKLVFRRPRCLRGRVLCSWWTSTVAISDQGLEVTAHLPVYTMLSVFPLFALAAFAYLMQTMYPHQSPTYLGHPRWIDSPAHLSAVILWVGLIAVHMFVRKRFVWQLNWGEVVYVFLSDRSQTIWIKTQRQTIPHPWYTSSQRYWELCGLKPRRGYEAFKHELTRFAPADKLGENPTE